MKKLILTILLFVATLTFAIAQTKKQYASPDPIKQYTFTIKAGVLDSLVFFVQTGSQSLFQTDMPAKRASTLAQRASILSNELLIQLRQQVVADSLKVEFDKKKNK